LGYSSFSTDSTQNNGPELPIDGFLLPDDGAFSAIQPDGDIEFERAMSLLPLPESGHEEEQPATNTKIIILFTLTAAFIVAVFVLSGILAGQRIPVFDSSKIGPGRLYKR